MLSLYGRAAHCFGLRIIVSLLMQPLCIRAYKIAVGHCTLLTSSIITVKLLVYCLLRLVLIN